MTAPKLTAGLTTTPKGTIIPMTTPAMSRPVKGQPVQVQNSGLRFRKAHESRPWTLPKGPNHNKPASTSSSDVKERTA